jgi:hypothetical protein
MVHKPGELEAEQPKPVGTSTRCNGSGSGRSSDAASAQSRAGKAQHHRPLVPVDQDTRHMAMATEQTVPGIHQKDDQAVAPVRAPSGDVVAVRSPVLTANGVTSVPSQVARYCPNRFLLSCTHFRRRRAGVDGLLGGLQRAERSAPSKGAPVGRGLCSRGTCRGRDVS